MLYGAGLDENDMKNPQIGIASMWWEGNSCNFHLNRLAEIIKHSICENKKMIGLIFGGKLSKETEIGYYNENFKKEF